MSLEVHNSPLFTTIQDKGRFDYVNVGVSASGVMDEYAYFIAHKLLNNPPNTNILEVSFSNVEFKVYKNTKISITGAHCDFFINGVLKPTWQSFHLKVGDIIKLGKIKSGQRIYLAVKNGFKIKKDFGSNSTSIKESLGGLDGDKLKKGDILEYDEYIDTYNMRLKDEFIPKYEDILKLRVILGYQEDLFTKEEKEKFFSSSYTVSNDFNRMACKLNGEEIICETSKLISEGICFGAIQIPKDGQPIILLKDRQTIGGYPKLGSVLACDCFKLSQMKANSKVSFELISLEEASRKLKDFYSSLTK
jgi:biotin-dependent carboxylase-like uncharacterized protein